MISCSSAIGYSVKLLLFITVLFVCDRALYFLMDKSFHTIETGDLGGFVNKVRRVKAEIVILGSSRARHHYEPEILRSELKTSVYNAGCDGQGIPYVRGMVDLLLKEYTPKLLIIDVDPTSLAFSQDKFDSATILAPFIDESEAIRRILYSRGPFEPIKYLSRSFRYNSKPLAILKNINAQDSSISGFVPARRTLVPSSQTKLELNNQVNNWYADQGLVQLLREIIQQAKLKGVKIILSNSPRWRSDNKVDPLQIPLYNFLRGITLQEKIPYLSVTQGNTPSLHDASLFADPAHLNERGAKIFTNILAQWIIRNNYFKNPTNMK
jgi:hypothetical protein